MSYQIECGHCGYRITLAGRDVPRTVKCEVCGGMLTIAVALPVAVPVAAPPPSRAVPPPPASKPAALPPPPAPVPAPPVSDEARSDAERGRHLAEPWPMVRRALATARTAADVGVALFGFFLFLALVATQIVPPAERRADDGRWAVLVSWALILPALAHVAAQGLCAYVPQTHGREWATASACMVAFSPFALIGLAPHPVGVFFVVAGVAAAIASFGLWLAFLGRLGQSLGDDALRRSASAYGLWFWFGAVQAATLLGGAYLAELSKLPALVWFLRAVAAAIAVALLRGYALLLRTALAATDRRAPVTPRS